MSLAFLGNITLLSNEEVVPKFATPKAARPKVDRLPETAHLRLFKNGAIYPSKALTEKYNLEYLGKEETADFVPNGFDIVSSKRFPNTSHLAQVFLLILVVPKHEPKVDVFGQTSYVNEADVEKNPELVLGAPKVSVLEQGTTTFGKEHLIPMLEEVYGFTFKEDQKYVDLIIVEGSQLTTNDGLYYVPKVISKGSRKGEIEPLVRRSVQMFPLVISEEVDLSNTSEAVVTPPATNAVEETAPEVEDVLDSVLNEEVAEEVVEEGSAEFDVEETVPVSSWISEAPSDNSQAAPISAEDLAKINSGEGSLSDFDEESSDSVSMETEEGVITEELPDVTEEDEDDDFDFDGISLD